MHESLDIRPSGLNLMRFAFPTIAASLLTHIYAVVDGIFVSYYLGTDALSAVNIIMPFLTIVVAVSYMVAVGGNAYISFQLGEGKIVEARENFSMLTVFCIGMCSFLALLAIILRNPIIYFLGSDDTLFRLCERYAIPLFLSIPFQAFTVIFQMFFVTEGKPVIGMCISFFGGVSNIALDYIFLRHLSLGISGAAMASGISYAIPSTIGFYYFCFQRKGNLCIVWPKVRFDVLLHMASNGASEMVNMLSASVIYIVMNNLVMRLAGSDGEAAVAIILYVNSLLTSLFVGYSMGVAPIISFRHGQKNYEQLRQTHISNLIVITFTACFSATLGLILAEPIVGMFAHNNDIVKELAIRGFFIYEIGFLFMGQNLYASSFFTALNNGKTSATISFFRTILFLLPFLWILSSLYGLVGLWIAEPLSEFCAFLVTLLCLSKEKNVYHY